MKIMFKERKIKNFVPKFEVVGNKEKKEHIILFFRMEGYDSVDKTRPIVFVIKNNRLC